MYVRAAAFLVRIFSIDMLDFEDEKVRRETAMRV